MSDRGGLQAWLSRFLQHLRHERRLSPHTLSNYGRDLQRIRDWCREQKIEDWCKLSQHQIRSYIAARHRKGIAGVSLQRELSSLRSLYRYLLREGACTGNPAQGVRTPKIGTKLPATLDTDQQMLSFDEPATSG